MCKLLNAEKFTRSKLIATVAPHALMPVIKDILTHLVVINKKIHYCTTFDNNNTSPMSQTG